MPNKFTDIDLMDDQPPRKIEGGTPMQVQKPIAVQPPAPVAAPAPVATGKKPAKYSQMYASYEFRQLEYGRGPQFYLNTRVVFPDCEAQDMMEYSLDGFAAMYKAVCAMRLVAGDITKEEFEALTGRTDARTEKVKALLRNGTSARQDPKE